MALSKLNISYSGKDTNEIVRDFSQQTSLAKDFGVRVIQGQKSKAVFHNISENLQLRAYECVQPEVDNLILRQRDIELCPFTLGATVCKQDLIGTYREANIGNGMWNESLINDELLTTNIIQMMMEKGATEGDNILLNGGTYGGSDLCTGLLALLEDDATVIDYTVNPSLITVADVITLFNQMEALLPKELLFNTARPVKFGVSSDIAIAYENYLLQNRFFNAVQPMAPNEIPIMRYKRYEVVPLNNLPAGTIFATYPDNVIIAYDDQTDIAQVRIVDKSQYDALNDTIQFVMKFRQGINYGWGKYFVYGRPA